MDQAMPAADELPFRVTWFAPWTWKSRWWLAIVSALFVAYPLSLGPSMALVDYGIISAATVETVYRPVLWVWLRSPEPVARVIYVYSSCWSESVAVSILWDHTLWESARLSHCEVCGRPAMYFYSTGTDWQMPQAYCEDHDPQ